MKKFVFSCIGFMSLHGSSACAQIISIVNDFGAGGLSNGWQSDDTRNAAGIHIINATTNAPLGSATLDPLGVATQIDWLNNNGSRGNLGGVRLDGTTGGGGKSTLSLVDATSGFGASNLLTGGSFAASYRWQNNDTVVPGVGFKIGIQSTNWGNGVGQSQNGFSPTRSGEGAWDLLLVYDPAEPGNMPGNTTTNGAFYTTSITATSGKFYLFDQSGNSFYTTPGFTGKTLADWAADPTWGTLLFGAGAKIVSTQFGLGSGNQDAAGTVDYASISYLNGGQVIDFNEGIKWTNAAGGAFGTGSNWQGGSAPGGAVNGLFDLNSTYTVSVPATSSVRSLGVSNGSVTFNVGSGQTLSLQNDGYLFADTGAALSVTGGGSVTAAVVDAIGTVNLATTTSLNGGSVPHPVRDGTNPAATTRYGLVVEAGGTVNLQSGATVTLSQTSKNVGMRVGEGVGTGTLSIASGATLQVGNSDSFGVNGLTSNGFIVVGDFGSTGVVNQTGGSVTLTDGSFNLGNQGGTGTWSTSGGTLTLEGGVHSLGRNTGNRVAGTGTLNISGSAVIEIKSSLNNGPATFVAGDRDDSDNDGVGIINQSGGTLRVASGNTFYLGGYGSSQYNLTGGTLEIGGGSLQGLFANNNSGTYALNLGGGTIKVIGSTLSTSVNFTTLAATESKLDLNGLGASLSGNISGANNGALNVLNGSLTFNNTQINGANVRMGVGGTTVNAQLAAGTTLTIANSGALRVGSVDPTVPGTGVLTLAAGQKIDFVPGGAGATSLRVGSGGNGTLNQSGGLIDADKAGFTIFMIGTAAGGNATFNQTGGQVKLGSNAFVGYSGATGVWTLSNSAVLSGSANNGSYFLEVGAGGPGTSGTLNIQDNAQVSLAGFSNLGIGGSPNDQVSATGNTGVVNQTGSGSSFTQGSGYTFIGYDSGTSGTYNLSAGTFSTAASVTFASQAGSSGAFVQTGGTATFSNGIAFGAGSSAYTLNGGTLQIGGANGISLAPGGTHTVTLGGGTLKVIGSNFSTAANATLTSAMVSKIDTNGFNATLSGNLSGGGGLEKQGSGTLLMSGSNSYAGPTTISAGTVEVTSNNGLGSGASGTTVASGATLKLTGASYTTAEALTINGNGVGGNGALVNSGTSTFAGQVTAATNSKVNAGGGTLNLNGGVVKDGTTLTIAGGGRVNVNGTGISGSSPNSDLVVDGTTLVVNADSNFNGPATVQNSGTLVANANIVTIGLTASANSTVSGTGSYTAGLGGYITVNGALIVGDSTLSSPDPSSLALVTSGAGSTILGAGSHIVVDLFSGAGLGNNTANPSTADYLALFGSLDATGGSTLVIGNPNSMSGFAYGDSWQLLKWSSGPASFTGTLSVDFSSLNLTGSYSGMFDTNTGVFTVVPEPSRALLLLLGSAGLMMRRRRAAADRLMPACS